MTTTYWAAEDSEKFADELKKRIDAFYQHIRSKGKLALWRKLHEHWHRGAMDLGQLLTDGEKGELTRMSANHIRNIGTHTVNLITAQRPAFDAKAENADYASAVQCELAQSILDFDMKDKRLEDRARKVVEYAVRYGEGWGLKVWDTMAGEPWGIDPDTGKPINSGQLRYAALTPADVPRDVNREGSLPQAWLAPRRWVNRYDLLARYPEHAKAIENAQTKKQVEQDHPIIGYDQQAEVLESDDVELFEFYHARSEALPDGRRALYVNGEVIEDGPLPYKRLPLFRLAAGDHEGTAFGYTISFDLAPLQDAVDALFSTVASNQAAFGVQSILVPKGHDMNVTQLSRGLQALSYDPGIGPPVPLQLVKTAPETFTFLQLLISTMETLSGISSVVRGDPQASLKSGSALAMVASQALQYTIDLQASYVAFMEDISTAAIEDYKDFAELPQVMLMVGKSSASRLREWRGQDISRVARITVDIGNALSKTLAGRSEMATQLVQAGLVEDPRQYIQVLTTGRLEPVTKGASSELLLISAENERLGEGEMVPVIDTDDHVLHLKEHKTVLASPAAREDEAVVQATLEHKQLHLEALRMTDPLLLSVLGIAVPPDNQGAPVGPPAPAEPLPPGPAGASGGPDYVPPLPNMPQPPVNPSTGQPASAPVAAPTPPGAQPAGGMGGMSM